MKRINLVTSSLTVILLLWIMQPVFAQNEMTTSQVDKRHDDIESLYARVYHTLDKYPNVSYSYQFQDGQVTGVTINGVPNEVDRLDLESNLLRIEGLKNEIINQKSSSGIYYVTEKEAHPKNGYVEFYRELHRKLVYPNDARKNNVEGTIVAKFIVDAKGNIEDISTSTSIDTPFKLALIDMQNEVKKVIQSTSGEWIPAKFGDDPVDQWVYLPVKFDLENNFGSYYPEYPL